MSHSFGLSPHSSKANSPLSLRPAIPVYFRCHGDEPAGAPLPPRAFKFPCVKLAAPRGNIKVASIQTHANCSAFWWWQDNIMLSRSRQKKSSGQSRWNSSSTPALSLGVWGQVDGWTGKKFHYIEDLIRQKPNSKMKTPTVTLAPLSLSPKQYPEFVLNYFVDLYSPLTF